MNCPVYRRRFDRYLDGTLASEERAKIEIYEFTLGDTFPNGFDPRQETKPAARALYGHFLAGRGSAYVLLCDGAITNFEPHDIEGNFGPLTPDRLEEAANSHAARLLTARTHARVVNEAVAHVASGS